jgi:four helix bundle protein
VIRTYKDLEVYNLSYDLAMDIFWLSKNFPKDENYSLVSQIRNSSRSIPANIGEGWAKRRYENVFKRHLMDAIGSCDETRIWLDFSRDCGYIPEEGHERLAKGYDEVGKMLNGLFERWQRFAGSKA